MTPGAFHVTTLDEDIGPETRAIVDHKVLDIGY
jgi:hypothetical protein